MDAVPLQQLIDIKEEAVPFRGLVVLNGDLGGDSVETALRKLSGHKILSAPVLLPSGGYAMVDMVGIAYALASNLETFLQPVSTVIPISERIDTLDVETTLQELVQTLYSKRIHRIIISKDGKPYHVLSQMDVIRFVNKHRDLIPENTRKSLVKSFMSTPPLTVNADDRVSDALKKIINDAYSGAAVVDEEGRVQANFSVSDLRGIPTSRHYLGTLMDFSVKQFLVETKMFAKLPVELSEDSTFEQAINEIARHNVHRLHVVDSEERPLGVVTSTDLILCLAAAKSGAEGL